MGGCKRQAGRAPAVEASIRAAILQEAFALPGGHRGLRHLTSLVAGVAGTRPHRPPDASGLGEE